MNQTRSLLFIAWFFVAAMLWMEWSKQGSAPPAGDVAPAAAAPDAATNAVSRAVPPPALPNTGTSTALPQSAPAVAPAAASAETITLANDVLRLTVDLHGGRVLRAELLAYPVEKKAGSPNVVLLDDQAAQYFSADAGLIRVQDGQQQELPLHFASSAKEFRLAAGADRIAAPLQWNDAGSGLSLDRQLILRRGSYVLEVEDALGNGGTQAQQLYPVQSLQRVAPPAPPKHSFMTSPETFSFIGAAWYTPDENYQKAALNDFDDETPRKGKVAGGWIAMLQHHFVSAWVPLPGDEQFGFETSTATYGGVPLYVIRSIAAPIALAPGGTQTHASRLWIGPKLQAPMQALHPELDRSVDYGIFYVISKPLFWLLSKLHALLGNWGWAIIAIVLLLKAALYWFSKKQYENMAKMRAIQPRLEALKERYGDDRQKFAMAQMELFQKEKINPLGGCLPMLIPIPIFLGLYWVLLETVELRHAAWIGWIQNLTAADPYFVLPALNLAVMYLTQKLTPTPGMDPMQKKMMQFMPLFFGVMMAFFPAGLVLYWVTNGALGLLQQWWMTKQHGGAPATAR